MEKVIKYKRYRTWWAKEYYSIANTVMGSLMNICYSMVDDPSSDSKTSYKTGPPQFTLIKKGKLKYYYLERPDVEEHYDELEEQIWGLKNEQE